MGMSMGNSFGDKNEARNRILGFALSYDLTVINTYFRKKEKHYIIYKYENRS